MKISSGLVTLTSNAPVTRLIAYRYIHMQKCPGICIWGKKSFDPRSYHGLLFHTVSMFMLRKDSRVAREPKNCGDCLVPGWGLVS